jgi:hypothetical protein
MVLIVGAGSSGSSYLSWCQSVRLLHRYWIVTSMAGNPRKGNSANGQQRNEIALGRHV